MWQQAAIWWGGGLREKLGQPKVSYLRSGRYVKQKDRTKKREWLSLFESELRSTGMPNKHHGNLVVTCRDCIGGWQFGEGKVQFVIKGINIPPVSLMWPKVNTSSQGCSFLRGGSLDRSLTVQLECQVSTQARNSIRLTRSFPLMGLYCYSNMIINNRKLK